MHRRTAWGYSSIPLGRGGVTLWGVADVLSGGASEAKRLLPRWVYAVAVALAAVVAVAVWYQREGPHAAPSAPRAQTGAVPAPVAPGPPISCNQAPSGSVPQAPLSGRSPAALVIGAVRAGATLDRRDLAAAAGPWAVVVRRSDGSLGRHGAVVTFPVSASATGRPVTVGGVSGRAIAGQVTWPIAGERARVRGDLGETALVAIAANTRVVGHRPVVQPPAGYTVASSGPYRSPDIREVRYDGANLPGIPTLPGLVYTDVASVGGFEDLLYATSAARCGTVHGQPAVVSSVGGGNGTLAWQVAPGLVGYVGYSGDNLTGDVLSALHRLAEQTRILETPQWKDTEPQVVDQVNDFG